MANRYDVIVVGAGVAGLLAAKVAGENGLEVALLEKKTDPTQLTRACGQTLISMNEYFFGNLVQYNARDKRICFIPDGFSFKYDGPYLNLYNLARYTPDGHKIEFGDYNEQKRKGDYAFFNFCPQLVQNSSEETLVAPQFVQKTSPAFLAGVCTGSYAAVAA